MPKINFRSKHTILWLLGVLILLTILIVGPIIYSFVSTRGHRYDAMTTNLKTAPYHRVALVFGAGVLPDGTPTPYLKHRVETAVSLYKAHRIAILLMTGDNSTAYHNEPDVMKRYAIKLGVPAAAIVVDDAGFNTYDSCYRAKAIFGLHDATIVTQGYHVPRAMTTCRFIGIQNIGVAALHPGRDYTVSYVLREVLSTDKMIVQSLTHPNPTVLGKPQPIK